MPEKRLDVTMTNDSLLPYLLNLNLTSNLSVINFTDRDILKIIRSLNTNKAHGHDDISIRMIKICDKAILESLSIIYKNFIDTEIFPDLWGKSNIVLVHKKGDKQLLENYRPVSLLPILGKAFEKLYAIIYFNIYKKATCCVVISLVFDHLIHVNISFSR